MFTANHVLASVFPPAAARGAHPLWWKFKIRLFTTLPGRLVSSVTRLCYAATTDARDVAISYFGVPPEKVVVSPLGSDTELFGRVANKSTDEIRQQVRQELGIKDDVVVFIYTGRFSADKNPRLLAQAVARLNECGVNVKGLFIGAGEQQDDIANTPCCSILPFVPFKELPRYYWAAEVGVWPRQESMSMIDAAAASLPIVVSDTVKATERFEGTGLTYKLDDLDDLVGVLRILARDANLRRALGEAGAERVRERHSWFLIAKARANDYEAAVATRSRT
jgi:glycosyltransferase involved in cell wall biosynthesis